MNRKHFLIAFGLLCIGTGLWFMFRQPPAAEETPTASVSKPEPAPQSPPGSQAARPSEEWPDFGTPEFKSKALERGEKWLNARGRDAASLVAAWDITGEESLLLEAAKNFPGDPRVCIAMIGHLLSSDRDAGEWIDRLAAVEPQNPAALYLRAAAQNKSGDGKAAIETLRQAVKLSGKVDLHLRERVMTVREAALASGAGVRDAAVLSAMAPQARGSGGAYQLGGSHRALSDAIKSASEAGRTDELMELSGISLAMANQMAAAPSPTLLDLLVENSWRRTTLQSIPGDTEYGDSGTTAAHQLEQAEANRTELQAAIKQSQNTSEWLGQASEAETASYVDTWLLHGELEALKTIKPDGTK